MSDLTPQPKDRKLIASAILIGLIVVGGLFVVLLRLFGDDAKADDPTPGPSATSVPAGSSSACGLADGSQELPSTAPDTKWYFKGKVAVPRSAEYGPAEGTGDASVARCFAHNPTGALFAAATIAAETSSFSPVAEKAVRAHIVPGELREELLSQLDPEGGTGPLAQIVGFKFEDHTPDRTTLTLATRLVDGPNAGAIGATPMTMVWANGDWYQELQPSATTVVITSLDGFVPWSGIS